MTHWRSSQEREKFNFREWLKPPRDDWFRMDPPDTDNFLLGVLLGLVVGGLVVFGIML